MAEQAIGHLLGAFLVVGFRPFSTQLTHLYWSLYSLNDREKKINAKRRERKQESDEIKMLTSHLLPALLYQKKKAMEILEGLGKKAYVCEYVLVCPVNALRPAMAISTGWYLMVFGLMLPNSLVI